MVSTAAHAMQKIQRPKKSTPATRAITSDVANEIAARTASDEANAADMPKSVRAPAVRAS